MTQPPNSGAPQPVQGVTGGPPVLGGQIGNDPNTGNVVINPNPGNAVEIKKSPSAFNVYEYFNSNTDNSRLTLATALGGPDVMGIVSAPTSVNRDLQIVASGNGVVRIPALQLLAFTAQVTGNNQAIPSGAQTLYTWGTTPATDIHNGIATFAAATGLTITKTGVYQLIANGSYGVSTAGSLRYVGINRNGLNLISQFPMFVSLNLCGGGGSILQLLNSGDIISMQTFQDSGAALTFNGILSLVYLGSG